MRFAKLEIKIIIALLVVGFDFDLVNSSGKRVAMPQPDRNDLHMVCAWSSSILGPFDPF